MTRSFALTAVLAFVVSGEVVAPPGAMGKVPIVTAAPRPNPLPRPKLTPPKPPPLPPSPPPPGPPQEPIPLKGKANADDSPYIFTDSKGRCWIVTPKRINGKVWKVWRPIPCPKKIPTVTKTSPYRKDRMITIPRGRLPR